MEESDRERMALLEKGPIKKKFAPDSPLLTPSFDVAVVIFLLFSETILSDK